MINLHENTCQKNKEKTSLVVPPSQNKWCKLVKTLMFWGCDQQQTQQILDRAFKGLWFWESCVVKIWRTSATAYAFFIGN